MLTDNAPSASESATAAGIRSDDGLRRLLARSRIADCWETSQGQDLLAEIRRRAARNAAHIASSTETSLDRDLVDDVVMAAWMVLRQNRDKITSAQRPWAYLMSSAQRHVLAELRAQQLLTSTASIRGRARDLLPRVVNPVGSTATDLAIALRHEPHNISGAKGHPDMAHQVRLREDPPLIDETITPARSTSRRSSWFTALVDLLVQHGADRFTTAAAIDRLADLFTATSAGRWEWEARRDPILARLGLAPDQAGSLVALVAGSRRTRHNGRHDSLLRAIRAVATRGANPEVTASQERRLATYTNSRHRPEPGPSA